MWLHECHRLRMVPQLLEILSQSALPRHSLPFPLPQTNATCISSLIAQSGHAHPGSATGGPGRQNETIRPAENFLRDQVRVMLCCFGCGRTKDTHAENSELHIHQGAEIDPRTAGTRKEVIKNDARLIEHGPWLTVTDNGEVELTEVCTQGPWLRLLMSCL